jgi:hypothetical protein
MCCTRRWSVLVVDLLKRYVHVDDYDDTRTIRARLTGQVLTLDDALQETMPETWYLVAGPYLFVRSRAVYPILFSGR